MSTTTAAVTLPPAPQARRPIEVRLRHVWCVVCGSDDPRPYKRDMYSIGATAFHLVRCRQCGFVYVDPRPDAATIAWMYDDPDYYTHGYNLGVETENYFARRDELLAYYDGAMDRLEREIGGPGDLLELGSAGGFLLEAARRRGWRVRGVEVSPPAARYSVEEFGLEVFEGQLEEAPIEGRSLDVIVADNVLEHTDDPLQVLKQMRDLLRPGGHVVLIVPTYVNSVYFRLLMELGRLLPRRLLGAQLLHILKLEGGGDAGLPYHILEFDRRTLLRLVHKAGLDVAVEEGSVPLPAHLFKRAGLSLRERLLKGAFASMDALMRRGLLPGARLRVVARRPAE